MQSTSIANDSLRFDSGRTRADVMLHKSYCNQDELALLGSYSCLSWLTHSVWDTVIQLASSGNRVRLSTNPGPLFCKIFIFFVNLLCFTQALPC